MTSLPRTPAARVLPLVGAAALGGLVLLPGVVERALNKVHRGDLPPVDDATLARHESLTIVDLHADTLLWSRDLLRRSRRGHLDLPRLEAGNVALQVFSSVTKTPRGMNYDANDSDSDAITLLALAQRQAPRTWTSLLERSLHHAGKLEAAAARSGGRLRLIRTGPDLDRLLADRAAGRRVTGALFSVEGLHNIEGEIGNLGRLVAAGMRMAGFVHFFDNEVAGSMHGLGKGALTDLGREVFDECERRGVLVDLAHASHAAIADMLGRATRPVLASHGGVHATCEVNRNLTDDEIRGIAATGGVVGIGYWPGAVGEPTPAAVVDAIEHVIVVGGPGCPALGSDFDGAVTVGWDASDLVVLTQELRRRGHSATDIAAVMGGNAIRLLRTSLPPRD